jgi:Lamin Tail Domain
MLGHSGITIRKKSGKVRQAASSSAASGPKVIISGIFYDGTEGQKEPDEYATISNEGDAPANLKGYRLNAGNPGQDFRFPAFTLQPGAKVKIYTNKKIEGAFSFGMDKAIWLNDSDCGYLYDPQGNEVSKRC